MICFACFFTFLSFVFLFSCLSHFFFSSHCLFQVNFHFMFLCPFLSLSLSRFILLFLLLQNSSPICSVSHCISLSLISGYIIIPCCVSLVWELFLLIFLSFLFWEKAVAYSLTPFLPPPNPYYICYTMQFLAWENCVLISWSNRWISGKCEYKSN